MRVVIVNRYASDGAGAEKHAVSLARCLRSRGHAVLTLSTIAASNVEREGAFVPLTGTDFWRGPPSPRQGIQVAAGAIWNRRAAAAMEALIARFRPQVVHAHDLYPQLSAAPVAVAARHGIPVVQTLHNYELISASATDHRGGPIDRSSSPASIRALRTVLHLSRRALHIPHVSLWIAVSRYVADVYARHGIGAEMLPNFVTAPVSSAPRPFERREGVAFIGRLTEEKGARDVVSLAGRLPAMPVTVVGRGPLEQEIQEAASRLPNLHYAGFVSAAEVAETLRTARVTLVPSRWQEPAGLVALEAMAEGTPVVAYASGGLAEYVRDAGGGRVVSPAIEALGAAVAALHEDRRAWQELSEQGRDAVLTGHSPQRYAARVESLYRSLLAGRR